GTRDVAESVTSGIPVSGCVRRLADADSVEDQDDRSPQAAPPMYERSTRDRNPVRSS
ncbi:MAG: hypothetical protein QOK07_587, partial [Gemmatimonadaceae bacterium]|nr:hypothetical protein [Gemmatimonadaceae bacterium]